MSLQFAIIMCLYIVVIKLCRARAVTNVGRTCGPTTLHDVNAIKYVYTINLEDIMITLFLTTSF